MVKGATNPKKPLEHYGKESSEKPDNSAVIESSLDDTIVCNDVISPLVLVASKIMTLHLGKVQPDSRKSYSNLLGH